MVKTQIYIALITYLLVYTLHQKQNTPLSLTLFLSVLQSGLFQRPETDTILEARRREYAQLQPGLI